MSKYNTAKIIKNTTYLLLLLFIVGYTIFNSRIFIAGPQINIESPENGSSITESPLIKVSGTAENIAFIDINGRQINVDEYSKFNESVLLYPGYNKIIIKAKDKFEREIIKKIELIYKNDDLLNQKIIEQDILENSTSTLEISTSSPTTSLEEI